MNIAVRYYSRSGNTKKVADAVAAAAGTAAADTSAPLAAETDLLFLGGSVYAFGLDDNIKQFIDGLDAGKVAAAAVFGTSAIAKTGNQAMRDLLAAKGIRVLEAEFYCRGAFTVMHRGHPNAEDLKKAADFAREALGEAKQP